MRKIFVLMVLAWLVALTPIMAVAANEVLGELQFEGKSKVERTSGVWVDGQYVGYLGELNGSKQVLLLPGVHTVTVRQDGYQDFVQRVSLNPGETQVVSLAMQRSPAVQLPATTSTVIISVNPPRAAVFVDGLFVGHVGEFRNWGRAMLVAPGAHHIRIALPGYETFETQIDPLPNQKVEIKTDLAKSNTPISDPLLTTTPNNAQVR
jgi:hypothetical protein